MDIIFWLFVLALLVLGVVAAMWVFQGYMNGQTPGATLFGQRAERRLAVVEHASVDSRRKLVLIRRDGIEHLIMTGGPVDVVIETGIGEPRRRTESEPAPHAVFARQPRQFGQAAAAIQPAERAPERVTERAAE